MNYDIGHDMIHSMNSAWISGILHAENKGILDFPVVIHDA